MAQYFTDFSEYTSGTFPSDWTGWLNNPAAWEVRFLSDHGKNCLLHTTPSTNARRLITWDKVPSAADVEIYFELASESTFDLGEMFAAARVDPNANEPGTNNATGYRIGHQSGNQVINRYVAGTFSSLASAASGVGGTSAVHCVRTQVIGTALKSRIWQKGTTEPTTWVVETTDSGLTAAGLTGLFRFLAPSDVERYRFLAFGAGTDGDPAPTAPVSGVSGSGSAVVGDSVVSATGHRAITGEATSFALSSVTSGEGDVTQSHTGTAEATSQDSSVSAAGARKVTGVASVASDDSSVQAEGESFAIKQGSGAAVADSSETSGQGVRIIAGSGVAESGPSVVSGVGSIGEAIVGTGAAIASAVITAGQAIRTILGSGQTLSGDSSVEAIGVIPIKGTGEAVAGNAEVIGTGSSGEIHEGVGAIVSDDSATDGVGIRKVTGDAQAAPQEASVVGVGSRGVQGTADIIAFPSTTSGTGKRTIYGSGAAVCSDSTTEGYDQLILEYATLRDFLLDQEGLTGHIDDRLRQFLESKGYIHDLHNYDLFWLYLQHNGFTQPSLWDKYYYATKDGWLWRQGQI